MKASKPAPKSSALLGVAFDNDDGHTRLTRGDYFVLVGGSQETHAVMQETALKINEHLDRQGKRLEDASVKELRDIYDTIRRKEELHTTTVIGLVPVMAAEFKAGWISAFELLAVLSVYLGLFNLLPFPALAGGRLVFLGYELVTRRRPNPKVEAAVHMAGFLLLMALILVGAFKDVRHWFS